jgi:hypothetical protein
MRNEKSLSRYREEQNLNESDMNLSGFVCIQKSLTNLNLILIHRLLFIVQISFKNVV